MRVVNVKSLRALQARLKTHLKRKDAQASRAVKRAAKQGAKVVRRNVPVAFSELRDTVHAEGERIVVDAPHAAAVDQGSRPHMPPIEPIEKWVRLRGMQGLTSKRSQARLPGGTSAGAAGSVAGMIRAMEKHGAVDADAPRKIAFAIAMKIKQKGTKPQHYMQRSLPERVWIALGSRGLDVGGVAA